MKTAEEWMKDFLVLIGTEEGADVKSESPEQWNTVIGFLSQIQIDASKRIPDLEQKLKEVEKANEQLRHLITRFSTPTKEREHQLSTLRTEYKNALEALSGAPCKYQHCNASSGDYDVTCARCRVLSHPLEIETMKGGV